MVDSPINLSECTAIFEPEAHYDYPRRLQYINGSVQHPTHGKIAKLRCILVMSRYVYKTNGDFMQLMDNESHELMEFSTTLFDPLSNIRPWLIDGGYRSGSGCWGEELNTGEILYLEDLTVEQSYRRSGVGSWFLQKLLNSDFVLGFMRESKVYCWPMPPGAASDSNDWDAQIEQVNMFFRKNGFRRVGRTSFFAYSPNPNHPSRFLPIERDPGQLNDEYPERPDITPEQMQRDFPLHTAIVNDKTAEVAAMIASAHAQDPASIHKPEASGFTPIYIAAALPNLPAVRTLLDLGVTEDLRSVSNKEYMTPLEKLQDTMRQNREIMEGIIGVWQGYPQETLACEFLLKKAMGLPLVEASEAEYALKRRLGCTCGSCTDQWLSPRMKFRLKVTSQFEYDNMGTELLYFKPHQPRSEETLLCGSTSYLPLALQAQIYKTFFEGFRSLFGIIARTLADSSNSIPTLEQFRAKAVGEPGVGFYFNKGGRIEYAWDAVISIAKDQSALGDNEFENNWDDPEEPFREGQYANLPKCANDLAFDLVRRKLGIDPMIANGPYYERDEDEDAGMFDEDDDDDDDL
ncbi:hypothetical protein BDN70DRAFT_834943 [Pholiota conissans]|uniref:Ankyrin repeat family protein n=1 Tax=Pholiota conissans TaxID=109636 RepID=A0A9P5Z3C2_9AGAR|nr:hypothetical protein BDN70DRAFT_834943 [Pholiota conissans]